jgi:hypothetical protein
MTLAELDLIVQILEAKIENLEAAVTNQGDRLLNAELLCGPIAQSLEAQLKEKGVSSSIGKREDPS